VAAEDALQAMQRQVIGVLADDNLGQEAGAGQALDNGQALGDGLLGLAGDDDMVMTLGASVFRADMLVHEERRGDVIELFAGLFAEMDAGHLAVGASALSLGQVIEVALAA